MHTARTLPLHRSHSATARRLSHCSHCSRTALAPLSHCSRIARTLLSCCHSSHTAAAILTLLHSHVARTLLTHWLLTHWLLSQCSHTALAPLALCHCSRTARTALVLPSRLSHIARTLLAHCSRAVTPRILRLPFSHCCPLRRAARRAVVLVLYPCSLCCAQDYCVRACRAVLVIDQMYK